MERRRRRDLIGLLTRYLHIVLSLKWICSQHCIHLKKFDFIQVWFYSIYSLTGGLFYWWLEIRCWNMTPEIKWQWNGSQRENSGLIKNVFFSSVGLKMKLANLSSITSLVLFSEYWLFLLSQCNVSMNKKPVCTQQSGMWNASLKKRPWDPAELYQAYLDGTLARHANNVGLHVSVSSFSVILLKHKAMHLSSRKRRAFVI